MKRLLFLLWLCTFSLYADAHGNHGEEGAFMVVPPTHPLLVVASSPIIIKPRSQEEMNILNEAFFDRPGFEYPKKQYLERVFSKLTPGTLKNLLKYRFLLMELKEGIYTESEIQTLKSLEKIEKFLEPLHEIERESLKRSVDDFDGLYRDHELKKKLKRCSIKTLNKFVEVFGRRLDLFSFHSELVSGR